MTLSAFLRDYLYIALGGNRKGPVRRHLYLMVTMLLGGLWHGAGWNFVLGGGLHGIYLVINHGWRRLASGKGVHFPGARSLSVLLTFIFVIIAWVPFRSTDLEATMAMLSGMVGINGISVHPRLGPYMASFLSNWISVNGFTPLTGMPATDVVIWLTVGLLIIWVLPNSQQYLAAFSPAWDAVTSGSLLAWKPTRLQAIFAGSILFGYSLLSLNRVSEFLYFQF